MRGRVQIGLDVEVEDGQIVSLGPQTGLPDDYVLSPAFVNAHSHFEYRGLLDSIDEPEYVGWIREVTRRKTTQSEQDVLSDCQLAAEENVSTGVAFVAEHSDRPGAPVAMRDKGLNGVIFQEVITFMEKEGPGERLALVRAKAERARDEFGDAVYLNPHTPHTVDVGTFATLCGAGTPLSVHVAETVHERSFWERDEGPLAEFYRQARLERPFAGRLLDYLQGAGGLRHGTQLVHMCDADSRDIRQVAASGATVAHCPRSNVRLQCPPAPVREMLDAGIIVGLGLDSAASSGLPDMFQEMRAALAVSIGRHRAVSGEEVWDMATTMGALSLGLPDWEIKPGSRSPLVALDLAGVGSAEEAIERGSPECVLWQTTSG